MMIFISYNRRITRSDTIKILEYDRFKTIDSDGWFRFIRLGHAPHHFANQTGRNKIFCVLSSFIKKLAQQQSRIPVLEHIA